MPQKNSSSEPPPVMTWGRASFILIGAGVIDSIRFFFTLFWFFGPALAAIYCVQKASGWVGSLWGLTEAVCAGVAVKAGAFVSAFTIPFSVIMADAVGLFGFLVLGFWILITNSRLLKTSASAPYKFAAAFGVGEIPFLGSILPVFTLTLWRLYKAQIAVEREAYQKWEKETAAIRAQEQRQRLETIARMQIAQQEAVNEGLDEQEQYREDAENDEQYMPALRSAA